MRRFIDHKRHGEVCILDSLSELMEWGVDGRITSEFGLGGDGAIGGAWEGREFANRKSAITALTRPWEEGLAMMDGFRQRIARQMPEPRSVRRRPVWSETAGDVSVDRLLGGDPVMYRDVRRQRTQAPINVALLCQIGQTASYSAEQITWRGAAAVAVLDLLEEAGYSVELWAWWHTVSMFTGPHPDIYLACRMKSCGDPVDTDLLVNGLSCWYYRTIILGSFLSQKAGWHAPILSRGLGVTVKTHDGFDEHLDVSQNIVRIDMDGACSYETAIAAAKKVLEKATKGGDE